jgi:hypothetical protein
MVVFLWDVMQEFVNAIGWFFIGLIGLGISIVRLFLGR